jgi:hypothetical protein
MIDAQQIGRAPWHFSQAHVVLHCFFAPGPVQGTNQLIKLTIQGFWELLRTEQSRDVDHDARVRLVDDGIAFHALQTITVASAITVGDFMIPREGVASRIYCTLTTLITGVIM